MADPPPVFGPTVSHPLTDDFSLRANRARERQQPAGVPPVYPLHMRNHPQWSGNNELGYALPFEPDANNRQTILKMEEWGFPEVWTLCLGLDFDRSNWPDPPDTTADFDITALIQFGIGGVVQEVEIDWHNGTAISLPMNALAVIAQYNLPAGGGEGPGPSNPPPSLFLRASLSRGTLFQCAPTRSYFIEDFPVDVGGLSGAVVNIPPFAKTVTIVPSVNDGADVFPAYTLPNSQVMFRTDVASNFGNGLLIEAHPLSQFVEYLSIADSSVGPPVAIDIPTGARSLVLIAGPSRVTFHIGV